MSYWVLFAVRISYPSMVPWRKASHSPAVPRGFLQLTRLPGGLCARRGLLLAGAGRFVRTLFLSGIHHVSTFDVTRLTNLAGQIKGALSEYSIWR